MDLDVEALKFEFPDGWQATRYDDWSFYRNQFSAIRPGLKGVDLLAISPDEATLWFVEVKDYRQHRRTKPISLDLEVAEKVVSTSAALLPARVNANDDAEEDFARQALGASIRQLRVVLHLEQPARHSKFFPRAIDRADVQVKLRRRVKAIDPHALVVESSAMGPLPWTVK